MDAKVTILFKEGREHPKDNGAYVCLLKWECTEDRDIKNEFVLESRITARDPKLSFTGKIIIEHNKEVLLNPKTPHTVQDCYYIRQAIDAYDLMVETHPYKNDPNFNCLG